LLKKIERLKIGFASLNYDHFAIWVHCCPVVD